MKIQIFKPADAPQFAYESEVAPGNEAWNDKVVLTLTRRDLQHLMDAAMERVLEFISDPSSPDIDDNQRMAAAHNLAWHCYHSGAIGLDGLGDEP